MRWITVFHRVEVPPVWSTRKEGILIMARSGEGPRSGRPATGSSTALTTTRVEAPVYVNPATVIDASSTVSAGSEQLDQDKVLPLPGWLQRVYFIFPIVLYIPDVIFNYFVYSDGGKIQSDSVLIQVGQVILWAFMSIGIVGMAYLLSVLAPWHWGQGHYVQAFFCGVGVVIATAITTWNSLAYRSSGFQTFKTDEWVYKHFPQLQIVSVTMVLVAIAPPFWGLFWAIVQPTQARRSLRHLEESHAEKLLRAQQEAELKSVKAEANAKVREAQLRGMAQTAVAAREQAATLLRRNTSSGPAVSGEQSILATEAHIRDEDAVVDPDDSGPHNVVPLAPLGGAGRDLAGARDRAVFMNRAAAATPAVHSSPSNASTPAAAQPPLISQPDMQGAPMGDAMPWTPRRPAQLGGGIIPTFFPDADDQMTGTTGPRPAVRRPGDNSVLFRGISEGLSTKGAALVEQVLNELNPKGAKKTLPRKEITARLAQKLNGDEATAMKLLDQWYKARKAGRGGQS